MAKKTDNIHIVPNKTRGGWDAKKEGAERASKHFETKDPAKEFGKNSARNSKSEYIEHLKDGTISVKNTYKSDPNPPKDSKNR